MGFLVVYANQFLIRRKKKFGMYQILGMTKRNVSKIMSIETLLIWFLALVVGLVARYFISQFYDVCNTTPYVSTFLITFKI